ncbi:MAG: response regulator transcription factor [Bacteroidia bacterium]|jgi:two-component system invasion response regulator UvrY|nr:response regulator transcription factor [Bacteroidia bacterium]
MKINISLADDHQLVRKGIRLLLENINGFTVLSEAANGKELVEQIELREQNGDMPDIVLIDVNMPIMDGGEAVKILRDKYADLKIVALSVNDELETIRNMIRKGANAYLFKDSTPEMFEKVLKEVHENGFYYSAEVVKSLTMNEKSAESQHMRDHYMRLLSTLSAREKEFVILCCSEKTYKQIGDDMGVSQHTVHGYRESVFYKLEIKTRTGLVIFALTTGMVKL